MMQLALDVQNIIYCNITARSRYTLSGLDVLWDYAEEIAAKELSPVAPGLREPLCRLPT